MSEVNDKVFLFLGIRMPFIAMVYAVFLILWGLLISLFRDSGSITSLIPTFIGLPILIFSYLSVKFPSKQKIFMHIIVIFGLIAFFGGADIFRFMINEFNPFSNLFAGLSKVMLSVSGFIFSLICIRYFIFVRENIK